MKNWQKALEEFRLSFKPLFNSVFLVGSLAYGGQFRKSSDIDLVGTVDNLENWKKVCKKLDPKNEYLAERSADVYLSGTVQSLALHFVWGNIPCQIDIMLPDFYQKAGQDINKNKTCVYQRASNTVDYGEYIVGHADKKLTVPKHHIEKDSIVLISTPLCVVEDIFYMGVYHQKLFTGYTCLWGDDTDVKSFCTLGVKKVLETGSVKTVAEVIKSSVRYDRMSDEHKKNLINLYEAQLNNKI